MTKLWQGPTPLVPFRKVSALRSTRHCKISTTLCCDFWVGFHDWKRYVIIVVLTCGPILMHLWLSQRDLITTVVRLSWGSASVVELSKSQFLLEAVITSFYLIHFLLWKCDDWSDILERSILCQFYWLLIQFYKVVWQQWPVLSGQCYQASVIRPVLSGQSTVVQKLWPYQNSVFS